MRTIKKICLVLMIGGLALTATSCVQDIGETFMIQFENKGSQTYQYMLGTDEGGKFKPGTDPFLVPAGKVSDFKEIAKGTYLIFWGLQDTVNGYKTEKAIRLFAGQKYKFTTENGNYMDPKPVN